MKITIALAAVLCGLLASPAHARDEPKWIRVSSPHFAVLTDASDQKGSQATLRLEQVRSEIGSLLMRSRLHLSQPVDVIALKNDEEYIQLAPVRDGRPLGTTGFLLPGDDRNYIVLNLADDRSWQTVTTDLARLYLNDNYPSTQPWFDTGLISYFSSLQLTDQQGEIGADPGSFIKVLGAQPWMPIPELFATHSLDRQKASKPIFPAESWIVVHYLLNQNKLPETGAYFDWVQNQGLSSEQAIEKAYGMTAAQFEQAVKEYFRGLSSSAPTPTPGSKLPIPPRGVTRFTPGVGPLDIGTSWNPVPLPEARALVAEMMVRLPEHRDAAMQELGAVLALPKGGDSAIIHRARAWVYFEQKKPDDATEELKAALELSEQDAWSHYYFARWKYRSALEAGREFPGLANMLIDLRTVIDWYPDFAEAHNMLAMGRVEGGGMNSAVEAIRRAVELSPRNETYQLNMGLVNMAAKRWDVATVLLERLKLSHNPEIAKDARIYLEELPNSKKYGLVPKRIGVTDTPKVAQSPTTVEQEDPDEVRQRQRAEAAPDTRKTQFAKGRLLHVDCSQAPVAVLTLVGTRTLRLRTEDYRSLLLIGSDQFSCEWKNVSVTVNYKSGGKSDGDLVSLEVRE